MKGWPALSTTLRPPTYTPHHWSMVSVLWLPRLLQMILLVWVWVCGGGRGDRGDMWREEKGGMRKRHAKKREGRL